MNYKNFLVYAALFLGLYATIPVYARDQIEFSDFTWNVRSTVKPEGPMGNFFGGLGTSVDLLADGALRLSIVNQKGTWYAAEVWTTKALGYGTYTFRVRTPLSQLHPDVTLGLFTYSRSSFAHNREIDIEFSAWGMDKETLRGQYVIQPYDAPGHLYTFPASAFTGLSTQQFTWLSDRIEFASWLGYGERPFEGDPRLLYSWVFSNSKDIPSPRAPIHINLYLFNGEAPEHDSGHKEGSLDIVLDGFEFIPAKK